MAKLTMQSLEVCFEEAEKMEAKYIAVEVAMEGLPHTDIIISPYQNFEKKLEFYKKSYDDNLNHKYSKEGVKIIDYTYGNTFEELEMNLLL